MSIIFNRLNINQSNIISTLFRVHDSYFRYIVVSVQQSSLEKRLTDAFAVFDNARNHEVDVRDLGTIIRSLGKSYFKI